MTATTRAAAPGARRPLFRLRHETMDTIFGYAYALLMVDVLLVVFNLPLAVMLFITMDSLQYWPFFLLLSLTLAPSLVGAFEVFRTMRDEGRPRPFAAFWQGYRRRGAAAFAVGLGAALVVALALFDGTALAGTVWAPLLGPLLAVLGIGSIAVALFTLTGTWLQQTMQDDLGPNAGFTTLTSTDGQPATTGGQGLAWAITSKSAHPDVAAAYVDFITNAKAAQTLLDTGNLPTVLPADYQPQPGTVAADIATQYRDVQKANGEVPYLDYSTPTFYDTITAGMQELIGGQSDPQQFVDTLQKDYAAFLAGKK